MTLSHPPTTSPMGSRPWLQWFLDVYRHVGGSTSLDTSSLEITQAFETNAPPQEAVSFDFGPPLVHNGSGDLQGGQTNPEQYFHLTEAQHTLVSGLSQQTALTAVTADAPAGGTGTAAGGWSTAANRNTAIALINNLKTRVGEIETRLKNLGLLA